MITLQVDNYVYISDGFGRPLDYGKAYFGEADKDPKTYPTTIYLDEQGQILAPDFLPVKNGFFYHKGNAVRLFAPHKDISVLIEDRYGRQIGYFANISATPIGSSVGGLGGVGYVSGGFGGGLGIGGAGATAPLPSVEQLLELLNGQITQSQLYEELGKRIEAIGELEVEIAGQKMRLKEAIEQMNALIRDEQAKLLSAIENARNELAGEQERLASVIAGTQEAIANERDKLAGAIANIDTNKADIAKNVRDLGVLSHNNEQQQQHISTLQTRQSELSASIQQINTSMIKGDELINQQLNVLSGKSDEATSQINQIKQSIINQDNAQTLVINELKNQLGATNSTIENLAQSQSRQHLALSERIDILTASTGNGVSATDAQIKAEQRARADADSALSQLIGALDSAYKLADGQMSARLAQMQKSISNNQQAVSQQISTLDASYKQADQDLQANITAEQQARTTADEALTRNLTALEAILRQADTDLVAKITAETTTRTSANETLTRLLNALDTAYKSADRTLTANLASETTARTNGDNALTQRIDTLQTDYNGNKASVANQLKTLSDKDTATASQISSLTANVSTAQNTANTASGKADTATTKADNAQRTANDAVSRANTANSAITAEQKARADADGSLASQITALDSAYKKSDTDITARLAREETARTNGDNANAQALRTLESVVNGIGGRVGVSEGKIATLERTTSDTNQALATAQSQLNARFDNLAVGGRNLLKNSQPSINNANYSHRFELSQAPNVGDDVIVTLWGEMGADRTGIGIYNSHGYTELFRLVKIADGIYQGKGQWRKPMRNGQELTPNDTHLNVYFYPNNATNQNRIERIKLEKGNVPTDWTPAPEDVNVDLSPYATNASLNEFKQAQASKDNATAQKLSQLESGLNSKANTTALNNLTTKVNQVDGKLTAEANKLSTLQTTVQGQTASIQQHAQSLNGLSAQWTLKVQSGNIVSGIGLASNNGVSDFAVRADKFYIAPPSGSGKGESPFIVLTMPQNIGGVQVPAGTYIKSAFIQNGSIDIAKINKASIGSLSALSANIGHFKSAETGARLEIKDSLLSVYDDNNVLRVRLGLW